MGPLHGLAFDRAIAFDRDSFGDETGGRRLQLESMDSWLRLCPHDRVWLLRRAGRYGRPDASLGLLVCLHVFLLVHRLRAPRWPCSCYRQRTQPRDRKEDWHSASDDGDQLVHVPNCVLVPNAWHFSCEGRGIHPAGLLRFRHYFQVRSRHRHLPDLLREVQQAVSPAMNMYKKRRVWHHFADFSSRTDTFSIAMFDSAWSTRAEVMLW